MINKFVLPGETLAVDAARAPVEVAEESGRSFVDTFDMPI
jgi:hypothetical protein